MIDVSGLSQGQLMKFVLLAEKEAREIDHDIKTHGWDQKTSKAASEMLSWSEHMNNVAKELRRELGSRTPTGEQD